MLEGVRCADGITSKSIGKEGRKEGGGREGRKEHTGECRVSRRKWEGRARVGGWGGGGGGSHAHPGRAGVLARARECVFACARRAYACK